MNIDTAIINAAEQWGLQVNRIRRDISVAGSPERCEFRFVVECSGDWLYVLESITGSDIGLKTRILSVLDFLVSNGMPQVTPYLRTRQNECMVRSDNRIWQISPYIHGCALNRPEYVFDSWRGHAMASFLIALRKHSEKISRYIPLRRFSISDYIRNLIPQIRQHDPGVLDGVLPIVRFLEKRFMALHDRLPVAFCHGDFHPLNIIWSTDSIRTVIDWEFLGIKPEIYDAANLVGCIGIEDPHGLLDGLTTGFIQDLIQAGIMSDTSWEMFVEFVITLRFAWLSEWLRHGDREMIEMETVYLNLLMENSRLLKNTWSI